MATVSVEGVEWKERGACRGLDPRLFFPDESEVDNSPECAAAVEQAKAVCACCDVQAACLEHALARREKEGVWGGCTERDRRRILRQRRRGA